MSQSFELREAEQALAASCYQFGSQLLEQTSQLEDLYRVKQAHFIQLKRLTDTQKWQWLKQGFSLSDDALSLLAIVYIFQLEPDLQGHFFNLSWYDQRGITAKRALALAINQTAEQPAKDYVSLLSNESNLVKYQLLLGSASGPALVQNLAVSANLFYWLASSPADSFIKEKRKSPWLKVIEEAASPATIATYQADFHRPSDSLNIINIEDDKESLAFIHALLIETQLSIGRQCDLWLLHPPNYGSDSLAELQGDILAIQLDNLPNQVAIYWPTLLNDSLQSHEIRLVINQLMQNPNLLLFCQPFSMANEQAMPLSVLEMEKRESLLFEPLIQLEFCAEGWMELCNAEGKASLLTQDEALILAERYPLNTWQMKEAFLTALDGLAEGDVVLARIQQACLQHMTAKSNGLARFSLPRGTLDDMVLSHDTKDQIQEILARMQYKSLMVQQIPQFFSGTQALFWGAPGTGKTMAAEAIAGELNLPLYKVNLANVASKWIGETEKHLAKLFDQAEAQRAVLLFDEADAIFAKRSEVESSQDKNANMGVSYLLQRMESYQGVLLLSTNFKANIDNAFLRRFTTVAEFALPDKKTRKQLWQKIWQGKMQLDSDINIDSLAAEFELSPSQIRNIAERACLFAAMASSQTITKGLLAKALRREFDKQSAGFATAKRLSDWLKEEA